MFGFRYPAVVILFFIVVGTLLGWMTGAVVSSIIVLLLAAAVALTAAIFIIPRRFFIIPLGLFIMLASFYGAGAKFHSFPDDDISHLVGYEKNIRFFVHVERWPLLKRQSTQIACAIDSVVVEDSIRTASGSILLIISRATTHFAYGDQISFEGRLTRPNNRSYPGGFDYRNYLFNKGIRGVVYLQSAHRIFLHNESGGLWSRGIHSTRLWILKTFRDNMTEVSAALASGFLIGETRDIPEDIYESFRRTGTMHLLAVSGSNVAIVILVALAILRFLPLHRYVRIGLLLLLIPVFSHLSYNQPSVIRASVMAALILMAQAFYRRTELNNIIAAAAAILIAWDPGNLFDIGFQLSFAVAWALILILPQINRLYADRQLPQAVKYFILIASSSLIASLVASPITAYYFGQTSLITIFSNLIIVPLVSVAVAGIIILLLVNLIFPPLAVLPGIIIDRLLVLTSYMVEIFGSWKLAAVDTGTISPLAVYMILGLVLVGFWAFRYFWARRLLVFFVLAGVALFFISGIGADQNAASIEIFNHGPSQSMIFNYNGGVAVYHQSRPVKFDDFSDNMLGYLKARQAGIPRYLVFLEPDYQTLSHLENALFRYPDLNFRSFNGPTGKIGPVWITGPGPEKSIDISANVFRVAQGYIELDLTDRCRVVISDNLASLKKILTGKQGSDDLYFCLSATESEMQSLIQKEYPAKLYVLPEKPLGSCKRLTKNDIERLRDDFGEFLICQGENTTIKLQ